MKIQDPEWRRAPAVERNRAPIAEVFLPLLPKGARVLEVASGTGEHGVYFANERSDITWVLSDTDADYRATATHWKDDAGLANLLGPVTLDVTQAAQWAVAATPAPDVIFCANMIHIAPWEVTLGLFEGAGTHITPGGSLFLYGPFKTGDTTAPSNLEFDTALQARNPSWGVRDLDVVADTALERGLTLLAQTEMPANNLFLQFRRVA